MPVDRDPAAALAEVVVLVGRNCLAANLPEVAVGHNCLVGDLIVAVGHIPR